MFKYGLYQFSVIPNLLKNGSLYKEFLYDKIQMLLRCTTFKRVTIQE